MIRQAIAVAAIMGLGACGGPMTGMGPSAATGTAPLPANLRDLAAPFQNLDQVRLQADDNCYWYLHRGPVETTLLPLRDRAGRVICAS